MPRDAKGRFIKADTALTVKAYKGFDKDLSCREYKYEVGQTYHHKGAVKACESGFHSCENPLDVLSYYDLCDSRFAAVTVGGKLAKHNRDSKIASATITIDAEIKIPEFIKAAVNYMMGLCKVKSGDYSQLAASGDYSKLAASGNSSQLAASGDYSKLAASGDSSKLAASGDSSKLAASGNSSQLAASGYYSKLAASGNSSQLAASGDSSKLAASGDSSQLAASGNSSQLAASGDSSKLAASGYSSIAAISGTNGKAMAGENGTIVLTRWVGSEKRYRVSVGYVGENIEADTWYSLDDSGNFVKVA